MKRRKLLGLALAGAVFPARAPLSFAGAPKKIVVVGAGLAGLVAGYELLQAGHDVTIVEARERPGGRVATLRAPFADGLHAEAGALFVPQGHALTLRYARRFGLALEPAMPLFESRLYFVRGRRIVARAGADVDWPFDLTSEERKLGRPGLWKRYVQDALTVLGEPADPGWPSGGKLAELDRMSGAEFLRSRGASPGAIALLRLGFLDMVAEGVESYSALQMLQRVALAERAGPGHYVIRGGTERLAHAFAATLAGKIRYRAPVVRIERGELSAGVVIGLSDHYERLDAERVVCTLPFSVLRRLEVSAPWSAEKKRAIDELSYTSVTRVFLQFRKKIWTAENLHVLATTDLPIQWVFEHTVNQPGRRGILEAQAIGAHARRLGAMSEGERIDDVLSHLEQIHPGARAHYERGASYCWDEDPWARGAFAYFRPGEMMSLRPSLARSEGRTHFAGDHTSLWSGWMQGALESGLRVAKEVSEAA